MEIDISSHRREFFREFLFQDCSEPFLLQLTTTSRPLSAAAGSFLCRAGELTSNPEAKRESIEKG